MDRHEYLKLVEEQIRCKKAVPSIRQEMEAHIEDQKAKYAEYGMEEAEAEQRAVRDMGDPVGVGVEMDRIHRPKMPWLPLLFIVLFSTAGFFLQQLAARQTGMKALEGLPLLLGLVLLIAVCFVDYSQIAKWSLELTLAFALLLWANNIFGISYRGTTRYLFLFHRSVSLTTLAALTIPLYGGILYRLRGQGGKGIIRGILLTLPVLTGMLMMPASGMAAQLFFVYMLCLSAAVIRQWFGPEVKRKLALLWGGILLLPLLLAAGIFRFGMEYQKARLLAFFDRNSWYLPAQLQQIFSTSSWMGSQGAQQIFTDSIPRESAEYFLAYLSGYYGILAAVLSAALMGLFFLWILKKALGQKNQLGMMMSTGCCIWFLLQLLVWVLNNTGVSFLFSSCCPFFSSSGTGCVTTCVMLGLILSVYRNQNVMPALPDIRQHRRQSA